MIEFAMIELGINCAVNKGNQFDILKIRIFTRTLMARVRQNYREIAVVMVQAVADHFNVSRITISRLVIGLR